MDPRSRAIAVGLLAGAVESVLPLELMFFVPIGVFAALLHWRVTYKNVRLPSLAALTAIPVVWLAALAHTKAIDRPIREPLPATRLTVSCLCGKQFDCPPAIRRDYGDRSVTVPSSQPTYRELDEALDGVGLGLHLLYCGNGSSFLWGGSPMGGRPMLKARTPSQPWLLADSDSKAVAPWGRD